MVVHRSRSTISLCRIVSPFVADIYLPARLELPVVVLLSTKHIFRYQAIEHRPPILFRTISNSQCCLFRGE